MYILVVDQPAGPLLTHCREAATTGDVVDHVLTLPELTRAFMAGRYDAVLATSIPGLDALTALTVARLKQPSTARVVLLDDHATAPTHILVESAHHVLRAPVGPAQLRTVLGRVAAEGVRVPDALADVVGGVVSVPSVRQALHDMRIALADPRRGLEDVGRILQRDPGLAAKVLHLANAGFARRSVVIRDLRQAAALLGAATLHEVIYASAAFTAAEAMGADPALVAMAQRHGVAASAAIQRAAGTPPEAATGALLLDIGLPLLALTWPEGHAELRQFCQATGTPLAEEERRRLGATHADAGALLARRWSMPYEISDMIATHHMIPRSPAADGRAVGFVAHFAAQQGDPAGRDPFEPDLAPDVPEWVWIDQYRHSRA